MKKFYQQGIEIIIIIFFFSKEENRNPGRTKPDAIKVLVDEINIKYFLFGFLFCREFLKRGLNAPFVWFTDVADLCWSMQIRGFHALLRHKEPVLYFNRVQIPVVFDFIIFFLFAELGIILFLRHAEII